MAQLDYICRECRWRNKNSGKLKCRREVKSVLVCNYKSMYRMVSARSAGALSKDGTKCKYFDKEN